MPLRRCSRNDSSIMLIETLGGSDGTSMPGKRLRSTRWNACRSEKRRSLFHSSACEPPSSVITISYATTRSDTLRNDGTVTLNVAALCRASSSCCSCSERLKLCTELELRNDAEPLSAARLPSLDTGGGVVTISSP